MDLTELIKEAFVFPSNNFKQLAIYIVFSFIATLFTFGGVFSLVGIAFSGAFAIVSVIFVIIAILVAFILTGYQIALIKSGIEHDELAPEFDYKENIIIGVKAVIVKIVYFIIPAIITIIVALLTGLTQNFVEAFQSAATNATNTAMASNVTYASSIPANVSAALYGSITVTALVAIIVFIIFELIAMMGHARLANTESLGEALNISEAFKDMGRIGYGNVIATVVIVCLVTVIINLILTGLNMVIPFISILSVIITPYLIFFAYRAIGSLYSEIA